MWDARKEEKGDKGMGVKGFKLICFLIASLEPTLTEEEQLEANNKKILKSIFLRELLYSTLVSKNSWYYLSYFIRITIMCDW